MADTALKPADAPATDERAVTAVPRTDLLETEDEFLVLADVPGVRPDDVDVRFENGELTFVARRSNGERRPTAYHRTFRLTEHVAADRISAELKHGVLHLHLPKVEAVKPRRIAVRG